MYAIDRQCNRIPILANDFFRHLHARHSRKVFLCGRKPENMRTDLRHQVKHLLETRMGCNAFLGEDIQELRTPKVDQDHLSLETKEAMGSDLVVIFLGSPGTLSEVTAFAVHREINPKTIVFNGMEYKDKKSFVNLGPLKLLKERVIHYDAECETPSLELIAHLDLIVAKSWFVTFARKMETTECMPFEQFLVLALVYASYPVRYGEVEHLCPLSTHHLRASLKALFDASHLEMHEEKYVPTKDLASLPFPRGCVTDIGETRLSYLGKRMEDPQTVSDYRLIV